MAAVGGAAVIYLLIAPTVRVWEGSAVFSLASALSSDIQPAANRPDAALIAYGDGKTAVAFVGTCSIAALMAVFIPVGLFLIRAPWPRRLLAIAVSITAIAVLNAVRVIGLAWAGTMWGPVTMLATHDWLGTIATALAGVLGLILLVRVSLGKLTVANTLPAGSASAPSEETA